MTGKRTLAVAAAGLWLVAAAPAYASHTPTTFGIARSGTLEVSSSVLVDHRVVDMRGGWVDESINCTAFRQLRVRVEVFRQPPGSSTFQRFRRTRIRPVQNCAEGGPNMGFSLTARRLNMDCPNGTFRPGRYDFVTRVRHTATGVVSIGSVSFTKTAGC